MVKDISWEFAFPEKDDLKRLLENDKTMQWFYTETNNKIKALTDAVLISYKEYRKNLPEEEPWSRETVTWLTQNCFEETDLWISIIETEKSVDFPRITDFLRDKYEGQWGDVKAKSKTQFAQVLLIFNNIARPCDRIIFTPGLLGILDPNVKAPSCK